MQNSGTPLGSLVKDNITGFTGIAVARTVFLFGCVRIGVEAVEMREGKPSDIYWFDEQRIEIINSLPPQISQTSEAKTGGPRPDVQRARDFRGAMSDQALTPPAPEPDTLEELYNRDPNKWTRDDVDRIVENLRKARGQFAAKEAADAAAKGTPKATKAVAAPKAAKAAGPAPQFSLEMLGIQIVAPKKEGEQ